MDTSELDLLQAARSEDLVYDQISQLTILGEFEKGIISTLKQSGAHLLQGSRGVGKSMLLRQAEVEMDNEFSKNRKLAIYVNFKTSTLLEGVKADAHDAFQIWVCTKILQCLYDKLIKLDLVGHTDIEDPYSRIFGLKSVEKIRTDLEENIHLLQQLAMAPQDQKQKILSNIGNNFIERVNDVTFVNQLIKDTIKKFNISKIVFLFDEAAHTFIPAQQEIFFEIFKLLHGGEIAVKAAVYPSVTSYGRNFEKEQDAITISMDRFETGALGRANNRKLFRDILDKRLPAAGSLRKMIYSRGYLLDQCIDLSTGNPRAFFHLLNKTIDNGYTDRALLLATQEFVDQSLLPYHLNLSKRLPKYSHHVRVGLDLLRGYIIPEIKLKNLRERKNKYQSAYFTIQRDMSPNLKLALDILCYSGVLSNQGTVKIADRKTGLRYMVHLALLLTEKAFAYPNISDSINNLSMTDYREFSKDDPQINEYLKKLKLSSDKCITCSAELPPNAKFCQECGGKIEPKSIISGLLEEPVSSLALSDKLIKRISTEFPIVGSVINASRDELMAIKYIKEVRSRMIKNSADEFISG